MSHCLRWRSDSRKLVRQLRKSMDAGYWDVDETSTMPVDVFFKNGNDEFRVVVIPRRGSCFSACCDDVRLTINKVLVPLPMIRAGQLSKTVRMLVVRRARSKAATIPTK